MREIAVSSSTEEASAVLNSRAGRMCDREYFVSWAFSVRGLRNCWAAAAARLFWCPDLRRCSIGSWETALTGFWPTDSQIVSSDWGRGMMGNSPASSSAFWPTSWRTMVVPTWKAACLFRSSGRSARVWKAIVAPRLYLRACWRREAVVGVANQPYSSR